MADKPDIALALEGGPKKKMGPPKGMLDMGDEEEIELSDEDADIETTPELEDAAGAVNAALASGDNAEIAKTLKGFISLCKDY